MQVPSDKNKADELTCVPQNWLKTTNICAAISSFDIKNSVRESDNEHHMGAVKTLYFFNRQNPTIPVSLSLVREVLRGREAYSSSSP